MTSSEGQVFGGSWTEKKLKILEDYLKAYNTALKNQPFDRVYIDAFAGTGYRQQRRIQCNRRPIFDDYEEKESSQFIKGSAKRALEVSPPFHKYIFVESDSKKVKELERLRTEHSDKSDQIDIVQGDANDFIQGYCDTQNWSNTRAVLFLDPFATQVKWATIKAIARTEAIDVWILFPAMAVNRLLAKDSDKAFHDRLDEVFGTREWFDEFYRTRKLNDIFGDSVQITQKACDFRGIGEFYKSRLKTLFPGVADKPKVFYGSRGGPLFMFFFAAGNKRGAKIAVRIAEHLLKKI